MPATSRGTRLGSGVRSASPYLLAGLLTATALVYASGVVELLCAAGLAVPRTRRLAGWATAALFVVVFPANLTMALNSGGRSDAYQVGAWARLPMQIPLIAWALSVTRHRR